MISQLVGDWMDYSMSKRQKVVHNTQEVESAGDHRKPVFKSGYVQDKI